MNPSIIDTDAVVIGLGPVGLYQVFQLGLAGLKVQGIDSLPAAGGQCRMLYPDKAVYDIPGFRRITGAGLAAALLAQLLPFQHGLHYDQTVNELARLADGRIHIRTASGMRWRAGIVVLALGAGAWHHRLLDLPGAGRHRGRQLFEQPVPADDMAGRQVVVLGGGNEALQQCLDLIRVGARVALVHKRARFSHYATDPALVRAIDEQQAVGHLQRVTGQPLRLVEDAEPDGRLRALVVADADDGHEITLPLDVLLLCHGLGPTLAPLADCGVPMEKRYIPVDPATCATSVPGILAVGDVCTYPGKLKLIGAGFHEAMLAARTAAAHLLPRRPPLEYTAISLRLQRRLGVLTEEALAARLRPHIQFPDGL